MSEPLPLSVELAREIESARWDAGPGAIDIDDIAAIIDARVRPLVEFARAVETNIDYAEAHGFPTVFADFKHLRERLNDALKLARENASLRDELKSALRIIAGIDTGPLVERLLSSQRLLDEIRCGVYAVDDAPSPKLIAAIDDETNKIAEVTGQT